ncbi:hypothetical protein RGQ21_37490 [Kitasatospora aureofaciens]|nr:hypothetical protein RGQ21_37490 [Kitasatospora aureofaciens]
MQDKGEGMGGHGGRYAHIDGHRPAPGQPREQTPTDAPTTIAAVIILMIWATRSHAPQARLPASTPTCTRGTRELETATHYLAWNQGVTRTRWLATRLGLGAAASMTAAGLTNLAVSWWSSPNDRAVNGGGATDTYSPRLDPVAFAARGVVPIAHAAFAFVLGVALGLVSRRTLPAMATTFALCAAAQVAVPTWLRPHLAAASRTTVPIEPDGGPISIQDGAEQIVAHLEDVPGAWVTSQQTLNAAGRPAPCRAVVLRRLRARRVRPSRSAAGQRVPRRPRRPELRAAGDVVPARRRLPGPPVRRTRGVGRWQAVGSRAREAVR